MSVGEILVAAATLACAAAVWLTNKGLPAYLQSYLGEKGKHLATQEDLKVLLEQIRQTTRATEEIKTVISEDLWVRQEQWKLKRDTYLKAATVAGELFNVQLRIHEAELGTRGGTHEERTAHLHELSELQKKVLADFRGARAAAAIVLAEEATAVMDAYQLVSSQRSVDSPDFHQSGMDALNRTYGELIRLARLELRVPDAAVDETRLRSGATPEPRD
jgi:hypothetical protein